jgi:hypothetical protein
MSTTWKTGERFIAHRIIPKIDPCTVKHRRSNIISFCPFFEK